MKTPILLALAVLSPSALFAQTLIDSASFFDPDFKVRREGSSSGVLALVVTDAPVTGTGSGGNVNWNHSVGGHAQVRTRIEVDVLGVAVPVVELDAQLAAYSETIGNSLRFG